VPAAHLRLAVLPPCRAAATAVAPLGLGQGRPQRAAGPAPCCSASHYHLGATASTLHYRRVVVASTLIRCTSSLLPALCVSPLPRKRGRATVVMPFMALRHTSHAGRMRAHMVRSASAWASRAHRSSPAEAWTSQAHLSRHLSLSLFLPLFSTVVASCHSEARERAPLINFSCSHLRLHAPSLADPTPP